MYVEFKMIEENKNISRKINDQRLRQMAVYTFFDI